MYIGISTNWKTLSPIIRRHTKTTTSATPFSPPQLNFGAIALHRWTRLDLSFQNHRRTSKSDQNWPSGWLSHSKQTVGSIFVKRVRNKVHNYHTIPAVSDHKQGFASERYPTSENRDFARVGSVFTRNRHPCFAKTDGIRKHSYSPNPRVWVGCHYSLHSVQNPGDDRAKKVCKWYFISFISLKIIYFYGISQMINNKNSFYIDLSTTVVTTIYAWEFSPNHKIKRKSKVSKSVNLGQ